MAQAAWGCCMGLHGACGRRPTTLIRSAPCLCYFPRGDEADRVRALKEALGLSDEDAAPAHIDVARRLYRQGFETKDRQQQFEQRKVKGGGGAGMGG